MKHLVKKVLALFKKKEELPWPFPVVIGTPPTLKPKAKRKPAAKKATAVAKKATAKKVTVPKATTRPKKAK